MRTLARSVLALLSISLVTAVADEKKFGVGSPDQYAHQENEKVLIGGKPFNSQEETKSAFGKNADLNKYGILPVLVIIKNNRQQALDLNGLVVKLVANGAASVVPLEPQEVAAIAKPGQR